PRQIVRRHGVESRVGEPHRVEHAAEEFLDAWTRMSPARFRGDRLGHDAAEALESDHALDFAHEPRGARGQENRVLEGHAPEGLHLRVSTDTPRRPGALVGRTVVLDTIGSGGSSSGPRLPVTGSVQSATARGPPAAVTARM